MTEKPIQTEQTFTKDSVVEMTIEDFGINGEGIGRIGGLVVFVQNAVPGDQVRVRLFKLKKNYAYGTIVKILSPSPIRREPPCPNFQSCGGCSLLHINDADILAYKLKKTNDALARIGKLSFQMDTIEGDRQPCPHRNKAIYHAQLQNSKPALGFYAAKTKTVIPISGCLACPSVNEAVLKAVAEYMQESRIQPYDARTRKGVIKSVMVRQSYATGEILVCIIAAARTLPNTAGLIYRLTEYTKGYEINGHPAVMKGISLNVNTGHNGEPLGDETKFVWGDQFITEQIGSLRYQISPASFFQVNTPMAQVLYDIVRDFCALTGRETLIDAYCGTGSIALYLAQKAQKIVGIELSPQAIEDAQTNAALNQIENVDFIQGDSAAELQKLCDAEFSPDIIILDPPRTGCSAEVLTQLGRLRPRRMVYVSCDPATLARDLGILSESGYCVTDGRCVDLFWGSGHVETVCLLTRTQG